jgi:hypothetical protein
MMPVGGRDRAARPSTGAEAACYDAPPRGRPGSVSPGNGGAPPCLKSTA